MSVEHIVKGTLRYSTLLYQLVTTPASLFTQLINPVINLIVPHDIHLPSEGTLYIIIVDHPAYLRNFLFVE